MIPQKIKRETNRTVSQDTRIRSDRQYVDTILDNLHDGFLSIPIVGTSTAAAVTSIFAQNHIVYKYKENFIFVSNSFFYLHCPHFYIKIGTFKKNILKSY